MEYVATIVVSFEAEDVDQAWAIANKKATSIDGQVDFVDKLDG